MVVAQWLTCVGVLISLVWGPGLWLWSLLFGERRPVHALRLVGGSAALGITFLGLVGWWLGILGVFTRPVAVAWASACALALVYWFRVHRYGERGMRTEPATCGGYASHRMWLDAVVLACILPQVVYAYITPFLAGDALYSFNTWAQHWGQRADLGTYSFVGYGQLLSIVGGFLYKITATATDALPSSHYVLHGFFATTSCIGLVALRGAMLPQTGRGNMVQELVATAAVLWLYNLPNVGGWVDAGLGETLILLFFPMCLYELRVLAISGGEARLGQWIGLGGMVAGLAFVKPGTPVLAGMLLLVSAAGAIGSASARSTRRLRGLVCSLKGPAGAAVTALLLVGPFYAVEFSRSAQEIRVGRFITDHTFDPGMYGFWPEGTGLSAWAQAITRAASSRLVNVTPGSGATPGELIDRMLGLFDAGASAEPTVIGRELARRTELAIAAVGVLWSLSQPLAVLLLVASGVQFWLGSQYGGAGDRSLVTVVLICGALAGLGWCRLLTTAQEKWQCQRWFGLGERSSSDGAVHRKLALKAVAVVVVCVAFGAPWWNKVIETVRQRGVFFTQTTYERLRAYFPDDADGVCEALRLHAGDFKPWDWRRFLIAAEMPMNQFLPNTVKFESIGGEYATALLRGDFTVIRHNEFPGAYQAGKVWIRPARRFFREAERAGKTLRIRDLQPMSAGTWFLLEICMADHQTLESSAQALSAAALVPLLSDETWECAAVSPTAQSGTRSARQESGWHHARVFASYGSKVYGGENRGRLEGLDLSYAKWLRRSDRLVGAGDVVFRRLVQLDHPRIGTIRISASDKYELYVNHRQVGTGDYWPRLGQYREILAPGDTLFVFTHGNESLLLDTQWSDDNAKSLVVTEAAVSSDSAASRAPVWYAELRPTASEWTAAQQTGALEIPYLGAMLEPGAQVWYYQVQAATKDLEGAQGHIVTDGSWLCSVVAGDGWSRPGYHEGTQLWQLASTYAPCILGRGIPFSELEGTAAKWVSRHQSLVGGPPVYFRKVVALASRDHFVIRISANDRYRLFVNGVQIGSGDSWPVLGRYETELGDGDVIGVEVYAGGNEGLLLDIAPSSDVPRRKPD